MRTHRLLLSSRQIFSFLYTVKKVHLLGDGILRFSFFLHLRERKCKQSITSDTIVYFRSGDDYDNCLLSDEAQINNFNDLDYDTSWNVYLLSNDCTNGQGPNYNCYRPIERDYNIAQRIIRDRIRVTNLRQCEDACDNSNLFNCRIFAYTTNLNSNYNCYLSDRYGTELDTGFDLIRDFDTDVYEKAFNCNNQDYYYKNSRLVTEGNGLVHTL